jgi:thiol-disulfide isomerase/thioredoxin
MKRLFAIQLGMLIVVGLTLGTVLTTTTVYSDVQDKIVKVLCLSCIKLDPKTTVDFTFQTADGRPHPQFIRDHLATGPIMIMYSEDVCAACEEMYPVVKDLLNVTFEKFEAFHKHVDYQGTNVSFFFINIDHTAPEMLDTRLIYDKDHVDGLPMFTFITLRYDEGTVRPYYTSVYGVLNLPNHETRKSALASILEDSIHLYHENRVGYQP